MSVTTPKIPAWLNTTLWGNTVALSWMWGLGLFFSVQFTTQFGIFGLLSFAIPNCLGLFLFGLATHIIANREEGSESLAKFFTGWSRPFRLVFFLYQLIAITLTIFALIHYLWQPLLLEPTVLYLPLTLLIILAAAILFGEEFNIKRIKFSHGVFGLIALTAMIWLIFATFFINGPQKVEVPKLPTDDLNYWGYAIPIIIGFLVGPWLDLQQWQRAIQMRRERISIVAAYGIGSAQFLAMLLFHGFLAVWALGEGGGQFLRNGLANHVYGHDIIVNLLYSQSGTYPWTFVAYCVFLCVCVLSTLDSGYIATRWFLQSNAAASKNPIFALIPQRLVTSPIPTFLLAGVVALGGAIAGLELEYFMIFYATFFVGYSALGIARCFVNTPGQAIPQIKSFCVGSLAVVIFAYGYFLRYPVFMMLGSLVPLGYILWILIKPGSSEDFTSDTDTLEAPSVGAAPVIRPQPATGGHVLATNPVSTALQAAEHALHHVSGHFEGKWFVHSFVATYADTNSVGNVYFGMYAMWVGKTRELFFNQVMPKFNLKTTPFYILTRSFEHKFIRETREFETVSVRIRIESYNRKFATLEHEIYDSAGQLLGKGKQSLLFVSSTDYRILDMPAEVTSAFIKHV